MTIEMLTTEGPASEAHEQTSAKLSAFWNWLKGAPEANRWLALWRTELPCNRGCMVPKGVAGYLELDDDLVASEQQSIHRCDTCRRQFLAIGERS